MGDMMRLKDEVKRLKQEIKSLNQTKSINITTTSSENEEEIQNGSYLAPLKPFILPLEYFRSHLNDYKNDEDSLTKIWNTIDIDGNDQIMVSSQCLNTIFKQFIDL